MDYEIKRLDESTSHFLPHAHQAFDVIGRLIPVYDGVEWSYREMLYNENRQKKYKDDMIDPKEYIDHREQAMFLAIHNDLCIGSIRISTDWFGDGHIDDLAVDTAYRRMGIGKALMDSAVEWCKKQQYSRITLETQDNNLQACRFYTRYGFALCGINTQKYALLPQYKDETALYFYLDFEQRYTFNNIKWLFFDVGSTLMNETKVYEHRMRDVAEAVNEPYEKIYRIAMEFYKQNKKGDLETAKQFGVSDQKWYFEEEVLYEDAQTCLEKLSKKYKLGVIANQAPGTKERLEQHGIMQYIDLVVASAEEGVAKPDKRIFEIALERAGCKPKDAVMIGDRIDNDIVPANLLGMHTIWVRQGFGRHWNLSQDIEKADAAVNNLMELCNIL